MGYVRVAGTLGHPENSMSLSVNFLTDTGAFFTAIPKDLADKLNLKSTAKTRAVLADKREVVIDLSYAKISVADREAVLPIAIMDVPEPLLGVTTLEGLGLKVNPVDGKLEKTRSFAVGMLRSNLGWLGQG